MTDSAVYEPLAERELEADLDIAHKDTRPSERQSWRLIYWAFAASILCMAGNISIMSLKRSQPRTFSQTDVRRLEFASTYMGLDQALRYSSTSLALSIVNFPLAIATVDSASPNEVLVDAPHRVTPFGTHFSEDRKVSLSATRTTFVQFWAGDFGMERCSLKLTLPAPDASDGALQLSDLPIRVHVYRVQEPRLMGLRDLLYKTRPQRTGLFTTWDVRNLNVTDGSPEFACPSGTVQTFELACEGQGCLLHFTQSPERKDLGVWLIQHSSL